jgi:hypothetical protein
MSSRRCANATSSRIGRQGGTRILISIITLLGKTVAFRPILTDENSAGACRGVVDGELLAGRLDLTHPVAGSRARLCVPRRSARCPDVRTPAW